MKKRIELKDGLSKDYISGLRVGLEIAKSVAIRQGYEISFPEIEDMRLELKQYVREE